MTATGNLNNLPLTESVVQLEYHDLTRAGKAEGAHGTQHPGRASTPIQLRLVGSPNTGIASPAPDSQTISTGAIGGPRPRISPPATVGSVVRRGFATFRGIRSVSAARDSQTPSTNASTD